MTLLPSPEYDQGVCLTLGKFLLIVYSIAVIGYKEDPNIGDSPNSEKLLILLERLELSKGF